MQKLITCGFALLALSLTLSVPTVANARPWVSDDGKFKLDAQFEQLDGDRVVLCADDGRRFAILLSKLSDADRTWIDRNHGPAAQDAQPKVDAALSDALRALKERQPEFRASLETARDAAVSERQQQHVDRVERLANDLQQFWLAAAAGAEQVKPPLRLTLVRDPQAAIPKASLATVVSRTEDAVTLQIGRQRYRFQINEFASLPTSLAIPLAKLGLPASPEGLRLLNTFVATDSPAEDAARWKRAAIAAPVDVATPARPAAPSQKQSAEVLRQIREDLFGTEYAAADTPGKRLALAQRLFEEAEGMQREDPAGHFMLLWESATLAAQAGRLETMLQIIQSLEQRFDIDQLLSRKADLVAQAAEQAQDEKPTLQLLAHCFQLVDEAIQADDYSIANQLLESATVASNRLRDRNVKARYRGEVGDQKSRMRRMRTRYADVSAAREQLKQQPADADANDKVGRYYCLLKNQWSQGLPALAKCQDPALRQVARLDLAAPTQPTDQLDLGHRWWSLSEQREHQAYQNSLQQRAAYWYRQVLPHMKGRDRLAVQRRLEQLQASADGADQAAHTPLTNLQPVAVNGVRLAQGEQVHRRSALVNGQQQDAAVWGQPQLPQTPASIVYSLRKEYLTLRGSIGYDDSHQVGEPAKRVTAILFGPTAPGGVVLPGAARPGQWTPVRFTILDVRTGKVLWGPVVLAPGGPKTAQFQVSVGNVDRLALVTQCEGPVSHAPAVWVQPELVNK